MRDSFSELLGFLILGAIILGPKVVKYFWEKHNEAKNRDEQAEFTPLPRGHSAREKGVPSLNSPERAQYELQRTLEKRERMRRQEEQRRAAQMRAHEEMMQAEMAQPDVFGGGFDFGDFIRRSAGIPVAQAKEPVAVAAPPAPVVKKEACAAKTAHEESELHAYADPDGHLREGNILREVREDLEDARKVRRAVLLREILSPPLSLREPDPFLTFPYER